MIRGDSLYCPLSFSLDSYWNCEADCYHCYLRRLNYIWGKDLRPLDIENFQKILINGLKNKAPKTSLAYALQQKKTIKWGNKSDPFQSAEKKYKIAEAVFKNFRKLNWSFVIQTMFTENMMYYYDQIIESKDLCVIMPVISPGAELDWEILETKRTTPIQDRIKHIKILLQTGVSVGVNGEPFIPGYHTVEQFEDCIRRLKSAGIKSYNIYNLHFNDFVAKRLNSIEIDIERIWFYNQDHQWQLILQQLIDISKQYGIVLGCPDFVNSGQYVELTNTCCGISVSNPCTWNMATMKKKLLQGKTFEQAIEECWDNVGNYEKGIDAMLGKNTNVYSLKDCGFLTVGQ